MASTVGLSGFHNFCFSFFPWVSEGFVTAFSKEFECFLGASLAAVFAGLKVQR